MVTFSNQAPLEILDAAQADSGWWVEAWEPDGSAKKLAAVPATSFRFEHVLSEVGFGEINIPPAGDDPSNPSALRDLLDVLCNPADPNYPVASLVKIFIDGVERYSFFTSRDRLEWSETGTIRVFGPGREAGLDWTFIFPQDNPANPIKAGDFIYGSDDNIVDNGGGEGSSNAIQNPDFETGDATGWDPYLGGDTISVRAADASLFRSGSFSMRVIPSNGAGIGAGVKTTLSGLSGDPVQNQAFCRVYIRDKVGAGDTILVKAVYDNAGETILDSATITLSTSWQQVDLSFFVPTTTPEVELVIINNTGTADFWVDDTDCFYSTEPFTKYGAADTFHLDETNVQTGRFSIKVTPDVQYGGIGQILDTVPGRTYRGSVAVVGTATEVLELSAVVTGGVFPNQTVALTGGVDVISFEFTPGPNQEQTRIWLRNISASPSPFWFDDLIVSPGSAATSPGGILSPQVVAAKARGAFAAYSINFDAATDAFGAVWTETALQISHDYGITLRQVADRLVGLGTVEWVVSNSLEWQVANRIGSDLTTLPTDVPTLRATPAVREGAELTERIPEATFVFLEGADGTWTTAADPTLETSIGRREKYIKNQSIEAGATLGKYANAALQDEKDRVFTLNVTLNRDDTIRPYRDFRIGDTILVDLFNVPGASNVPTAYRVRGFRVTGQGEFDISYEVIVNNVEYTTPEGRISRVIDQLVKQGSIVSLSASKGTVGEIQ